jgi:hypothetical protein
MGACCCGDRGSSRTVVVLGTAGSGVTTLTRRLRQDDHQGPRRTVGPSPPTDEEWTHVPLPSYGIDARVPRVRRRGASFRFIDAGPCTVASPPARPAPSCRVDLSDYERKLRVLLETCNGVVVVLDASRTLDEQQAQTVMNFINRSAARHRPLMVLLSKYDVVASDNLSTPLTPEYASRALHLTQRTAPWGCFPTVLTHRYLCLDHVLDFLSNPSICASDAIGPTIHIPKAASLAWPVCQSATPERPTASGAQSAASPAGYVSYDESHPKTNHSSSQPLDPAKKSQLPGVASTTRPGGYQRFARV